jgi:hypothetical protein
MAQYKNVGSGIAIVGFPLVVLGFIFLVGGNIGIGLPFLGSGLIFILMGVAAGRKGAALDVNSEAQSPAEGDGGRAKPGAAPDGGGSS